jgi:hypothetical protein
MLKERERQEFGSREQAGSKVLSLSLIYSKNRQCSRILRPKIENDGRSEFYNQIYDINILRSKAVCRKIESVAKNRTRHRRRKSRYGAKGDNLK